MGLRLSELASGDVLVADAGFTCVCEHEKLVVHEDPHASGDDRLYFMCAGPAADEDGADVKTMPRSERHYLNGQTLGELDDSALANDDTLVGLTRAP